MSTRLMEAAVLWLIGALGGIRLGVLAAQVSDLSIHQAHQHRHLANQQLFTMLYNYLFLLTAAGWAIAKPVPNTELTVVSVRQDASDLFRREAECSTINEIVEAIGTSNSKVVYTVSASVMALSVCQLLRDHGVGGIGTDDCGPITGIVAGGFASISITSTPLRTEKC